MGLRQAMEVVVKDLLQNNQGGIAEEDLERLSEKDIDNIVKALTNNDGFLIEFVGRGEMLIADTFDNYGDELGVW